MPKIFPAISEYLPRADEEELIEMADAGLPLGESYVSCRDFIEVDPYNPEVQAQYIYMAAGIGAYLRGRRDPTTRDELEELSGNTDASRTLTRLVTQPAQQAAEEFYLKKHPSAKDEDMHRFTTDAGLEVMREVLERTCLKHTAIIQHEVDIFIERLDTPDDLLY